MPQPSPSLFRLLLLGALAVITWLALSPAPAMPGQADKLGHIVAFASLAWLADRAYPQRGALNRHLALLLLYGAGLELIQYTLPYRVGSWADLLADAVGLILYRFGIDRFYDKSGAGIPERPTPAKGRMESGKTRKTNS